MSDLPGLRQRAFEVALALANILAIENSIIHPASVQDVPDGWGFTLEYPELLRGGDDPQKEQEVQKAQLGLWTYFLNLRYEFAPSEAESHLAPNQVFQRVFGGDANLRMAAGCWSIGIRVRDDGIRTRMDELESVIRAIRKRL